MEDLVIRITGDTSELIEKFGEATEESEVMGSGIAKAAGLAAAAFAAVVAEIGIAVSKYAETEAAARSLNLALQNQGIYSADLAQNYKDQAKELGELTGTESDSIIKAQTRLQAMIGEKQITPELTKSILDLAAAKNMDLESTAQLIGKGIDGQTVALKRLGIEIDATRDSEGRMAQIIEIVEQKFGGQAEAANQGLGSVKSLHVAFEELQKSIGEGFAPSMTIAIKLLTDFVNAIHEKVSPSNKTKIKVIDDEVADLQARLDNLRANPNYAIQTGTTEADLKKLELRLDILKAKRDELAKGSTRHGGGGQNEEEKKAADAAEADSKRRDRARRDSSKASNEALRLESQNSSKEIVTIKKDEASILKQLDGELSKEQISALNAKLDHLKQQETEFNQHEEQATKTFNADILANDKEYQKLDEAQKKDFLAKNQHELVKSIDTQDQAQKKAALNRAKSHIAANNQYMQDEIKFGKEYATLKKLQNDEEFKMMGTAINDLAALTASKNQTLKEIGKAASIANIIIKTAEAAMQIYAGFSTIPIIGPELGAAGAAAAVAFGAEQIQQVTSAAHGGVMTGGYPGIDSIPTLTMPGELVVPTKSYDEVVNSVADARNSRSGGGGNQNVSIAVGFDGVEAGRVITIKQNQSKALGTFQGIA